ncbi:hypothetical protein [Citrobacter phage vB_CfrS_K1M]
MIIEGNFFYGVELFVSENDALHCSQQNDGATDIDKIVIDKQQATQLIAVLQKWVDGGEME